VVRDPTTERVPPRRGHGVACARGRARWGARGRGRPVQGAAHRGAGVSPAELCDRTASELAGELAAGEVKASEILDSCLERIDRVDDRVKAFLKLTPDFGHELADDAGRRFAEGEERTGVTGIPIALKDVLTTRGITTTCGSKILHNY